ncbi:hypothetical protein DV737_g5383, partial [Chaetothyriales sp. CBS 132003]
MYFDVTDMSFLQALDEIFLRIFLLCLRGVQMLISLALIGLASSLISDFNGAKLALPGKLYASEAIACVCAPYAFFSFAPIFFEGSFFFTTLTFLDLLFTGAWIGLTVVWNHDATDTCSVFDDKYAGLRVFKNSSNCDCRIAKALFAFIITNLALFVFSAIAAFALRSLELEHERSWHDLPLIGRNSRRLARGKAPEKDLDSARPSASSTSGASNRCISIQKNDERLSA